MRTFDDNPIVTIGRVPKKQHALLGPSPYVQISGISPDNQDNPLGINSLLHILNLKRLSSAESKAAKNLNGLKMGEGIRIVPSKLRKTYADLFSFVASLAPNKQLDIDSKFF